MMGAQRVSLPKEARRFGRVKETFGDFGELREQKKAPHKEVMYVAILDTTKFPIGGVITPNARNRTFRAVSNATSEQIEEAIRYIAIEGLQAGKITQEQTEKLLDWCYAELHRRLSQ
jgi:hypothetical protein